VSRLAQRFDELRAAHRTALIPYLTAGDPHPEATVDYLHALVTAGADVLEVGVPFSDPMADGPVIAAACERALAAGTHLGVVLDLIARFRATDTETPVVLMGYLNPIDTLGLERFAERASKAGVDGVLIVDLSAEEAPDTVPALRAARLDPVCLIAPTTADARMDRICANAGGFIYYVSVKGVTGAAGLETSVLAGHIARIRAHTELPVAVGFGVRTPASAAAVAQTADAVVIGSALVQIIAEHGDDHPATQAALRAMLGAMRQAIDEQDSRQQEDQRA
jgi:tryptophan synthase alpha chain